MEKRVDEYTVKEMLTLTDSSTVKTILEIGIMDNNDAAVYPALADLLEREAEDLVKESLYEMLGNRELKVGTTMFDDILEFIMDHCVDKHGELYDICEELASAETLDDFLEKRRLLIGKSADTGETTLIGY